MSSNKYTKRTNGILKTIPLPRTRPTLPLVLKHYHHHHHNNNNNNNNNNSSSNSISRLTLHNILRSLLTLQLFIRVAHTQDPSPFNHNSIIRPTSSPFIDLPLRLLTIRLVLTMGHPNPSLGNRAKDLALTEP
jgi:hypothetical protein